MKCIVIVGIVFVVFVCVVVGVFVLCGLFDFELKGVIVLMLMFYVGDVYFVGMFVLLVYVFDVLIVLIVLFVYGDGLCMCFVDDVMLLFVNSLFDVGIGVFVWDK